MPLGRLVGQGVSGIFPKQRLRSLSRRLGCGQQSLIAGIGRGRSETICGVQQRLVSLTPGWMRQQAPMELGDARPQLAIDPRLPLRELLGGFFGSQTQFVQQPAELATQFIQLACIIGLKPVLARRRFAVKHGANRYKRSSQNQGDSTCPDEGHPSARQTGAEVHADILAGRNKRARLA